MRHESKLPAMREQKQKRQTNGKVLAVIVLFFIIILVILFFNSPFSKVKAIEIVGTYYVSEAEVGQAMGLQVGDQFFAVSSQALKERIVQLEPIASVAVKKTFPGHVHVEVTEYEEVAYIIHATGEPSAILANGKAVQIRSDQLQYNKPILTGWALDDPILVDLSHALATIPPLFLDDISEITPLPSLSYPDRIKLYTRSYFEVITAVQYLEDKLSYLDDVIEQLRSRDIHNGVITMLLADTHAPFESEASPDSEEQPLHLEID